MPLSTLTSLRFLRISYESKANDRIRGRASRFVSLPNFHKTGNVAGMKQRYYGLNALLVRCGNYIYNVSSEPHIYHLLAH